MVDQPNRAFYSLDLVLVDAVAFVELVAGLVDAFVVAALLVEQFVEHGLGLAVELVELDAERLVELLVVLVVAELAVGLLVELVVEPVVGLVAGLAVGLVAGLAFEPGAFAELVGRIVDFFAAVAVVVASAVVVAVAFAAFVAELAVVDGKAVSFHTVVQADSLMCSAYSYQHVPYSFPVHPLPQTLKMKK